jgi:hypothetical protein
MPVYSHKRLMFLFLLFVWSYVFILSLFFFFFKSLYFRPSIWSSTLIQLAWIGSALQLHSFLWSKCVRTHDQFSVYASSLRSDVGCFSLNFHFFTDIFPSPIYVPIITEVPQTYRTFRSFNPILFSNTTLFKFLKPYLSIPNILKQPQKFENAWSLKVKIRTVRITFYIGLEKEERIQHHGSQYKALKSIEIVPV